MSNAALKKIGITGVAGRMGQMLLKTVLADPECELVGGTEYVGSPHVGADLGELVGAKVLGINIGDNPADLFEKADVVVDFTLPKATDIHLELATKHGTAWLLGTTGLSAEQDAQISKASETTPILQAANFSLGVNLLLGLVKQAAAALPEQDWDIEVVETHHNQKIDAPSGTALALGIAAAEGRDVELEDVQKLSREGVTGVRPVGEIGFATMRGGDVAGEHQVNFFGTSERIEIGHRASDRAIFAKGAIHAAKWMVGKSAGHYDMQDVLGLTD
ncbi:MAG: 4-hydroxy-tetrahydrodipicolinate reductase [Alphaproteobacteria bacterium]